MVTAGFRRPAYRWGLAGAVGGIVLAIVTATALFYAKGDSSGEHFDEPVVSLLWQVRTGQSTTGPPGVTADGIVLGGVDGKVRAYDLTDGSLEWTFHAASGNAVYTRVAGGVAYAVTGGGEVFAIDAGTGKELWSEEAETTFSAPPAVGEGRIFISGADNRLHAYRIDNGSKPWQVRTHGEIRNSPTLVGDVAVVASDDGKLYMTSSGGSLRRAPTVDLTAGAPISTGDAACVALADGSVRCVRTDDGRKLARIVLPGTKLSGPARGDGVVFAAAADGAVGAWDKETGTPKWIFRPTKPVQAAGHVVLGANQVVVVAYPDGRLIGIDAGTGGRLWEVILPDNFDEGPRLDKTAMYIVGRSGTLYALQAPGFAERADPAPTVSRTTSPPRTNPDPPKKPIPKDPSPSSLSPSIVEGTNETAGAGG